MKNILVTITFIVGIMTTSNAQGITMTLGGNTADDKFIVENSDSEVGLVVTGEGYVGIGVENPLAGLHLKGNKYPNSFIRLDSDAAEDVGFRLYEGSTVKWHLFNDATQNRFTIRNNAYQPTFIINQADGNVGIGTENVYSKLSVGGNGTANSTIYGETSQSNGMGVYGNSMSTSGVNFGGYFLSFSSAGTGVMGFADNTVGTSYGGKFIAKSTTGYGVWGEEQSTTGVNYGGHFTTWSSSGRAVRGYASNTSGTNYGGAFRADGDTGVGAWASGKAYDFYAAGAGTNYGSSSSIRWKNNIVEIDNPLEKLAELRGVYFDWDEEHGGQHDIGCIAEEVGKVLPEIVVYEENGIDADGMDYSKLTPLLVEVAKAQQTLITELTKRVEELENR